MTLFSTNSSSIKVLFNSINCDLKLNRSIVRFELTLNFFVKKIPLLLILFLCLGFVGLVNAVTNDELLLLLKKAGLTYTKKCPMDSNMNTWNECIGQFEDQLGNKYFGDMNFGLPDGYGKYEFISHGNVYAGEFKNGQINGQGFRRSYDGYNSMQGEWKNGLLHGQGSEFHSDKDKIQFSYIGEYKDGKFHGKGKAFYKGKFLKGIFKEGIFKYPNNSYKSGNSWKCDSGYTKYEKSCIKIPPNTYVSGDRYKCLSGFTRNRKDIIEGCIKLPANAYAFLVGWLCNSGYTKSGNRCKKKPKNNLIADLFNSISSGNSNSSSYNYSTPLFNSNSSSNNNKYLTPSFNSNSSSGYKSSLGNKYQYDLSNPLDQMLYQADPLAQFRDLNNSQREMDSNFGQFGGGFIGNENNIDIYDWD